MNPDPECSEELLEGLRGRRIAVVGNATPKREFGALIDTYDVVIRVNNFRVAGFEGLVGTRTDLRCTTGFADIEHRNDHPEFSPFSANSVESEYLANFNRTNARPLLAARLDVHPFLPDVPKPSTGMALVQLTANMGLPIDLFGFDGFKTPHYWTQKAEFHTTHSNREFDVIQRRPNVILFGETYPYAELYNFCHANHSDYDSNVGLELVRRLGRTFRGKTILEFGAGNGDLSRHLELLGNQVTAVEVSAHAFAKIECSRKILGDAFSLATLQGRFDVFTSVDVLEHLTENDIRLVLREAGRMADSLFLSVSTRPSGLLGPNGENLHLTVRPTQWWAEQVGRYFDVQISNGYGVGQIVLEGRRKETSSSLSFSVQTPSVSADYCLKKGYQSRPRPKYFEDSGSDGDGKTWQPDVYPLAAEIARRLCVRRIIDVGCGRAQKLVQLQDEFDTIGFDFGSNLEFCRKQYSRGRWIEADFEQPGGMPYSNESATDTVVVCSDVIEHMVRPDALLEKIRHLLEHALVAVISTPERDLTWGMSNEGPPPNPCHTREWNRAEFAELIRQAGMTLEFISVTRSHDHDPARHTILAVIGNPHGLHLSRFAGKNCPVTALTRDAFQLWLGELNGEYKERATTPLTPTFAPPVNFAVNHSAASSRGALHYAMLVEAARAFETLNWSAARTHYRQAHASIAQDDPLSDALIHAIACLDDLVARSKYLDEPVKGNSKGGFSFCIITNGKRPAKLRREIESIRALRIPNFEILVGGDVPEGLQGVSTVPVRDAARSGRLGEMRNRLTELARFEHIVVADDDLVFLTDFFDGLLRFGEDYEVQCVRFLNPDGTRYWDWATSGGPRGHALLQYDETDPHVYVTGGLCIMKADVARRVKWNETLGYYKGEDTDFSSRLHAAGISIKFNSHCTVVHHDSRFTQFGKIVVTAEGLRQTALQYFQSPSPVEAQEAYQRLRLFKPELVDANGAIIDHSTATEPPFPAEIQATLDTAAEAYNSGDLVKAHGLIHGALHSYPQSLSLREVAAEATRAVRDSVPVPDLSAHVKPARLNIAMLTLNELEHTKRCLTSIRLNTPEAFNVFVVDNGSTDGTRDWLAQQPDTNLFVEFSPANLGIAGGRNRLLQLIQPHLPEDGFVIFIGADTDVLPGWVEHFTNFFAAHPHVGIGAAIGHSFTIQGDHREIGTVPIGAPTAVDMALGISVCWVRAATAKAVGEYDERLGLLWHGDDDYSVRALSAGWDVFIVPGAPVLHYTQKSGAIKLGTNADDSPANQRYLVNRWRALGLVDVNGQVRRPAPQRLLANAPTRTSSARVSMPVRWAAPIFNPSGYASEAISFILPLSQQLNLGIRHDNHLTSEKHFAELPRHERERLLALHEKFASMQGGIFISHNPAQGFRRRPDALYHIGRTMYETDRIPADWVGCCNTMDEVWVPSQFNVETFAAAGVERDKLIVIPGAVDEALFDPAKHQPLPLPNRAKFNFVSVFEWSGRKAWDVLLAGYLREFSAEDDVCLYLRTYLFSQPDGDASATLRPLIRDFAASLDLGKKNLPRIELLTQQIATEDLPRLYLAGDCLVVPSRGEGWGRPMHEAMAMGRPVIATNWSANTEFMNAENSYLLDYELVDVKNVEPYLKHYIGHRWANPSEKHLRETMRHVQQNPAEALAKGAKARVHVNTHFSRAAVAEHVMRRLEIIERKFTTPACPVVTARALSPEPNTKDTSLAPKSASPVTVAWDGSFLDFGSLSHVNRELTGALGKLPGVRLTRLGQSARHSPVGLDTIARTLKAVAPAGTQVTVRHSWPPVWDAPRSGKWIQIQPWEFGALPIDWAKRAKDADQIWAYSSYVRRLYITAGLDPRKVKVLPLGIDPARFQPNAKPLTLATKKTFKFLFVGGTIQRKGPDVLLAAYLKSFTATDDVCLVIKDFGGKGVYAGQTLETRIKEIQADPQSPEILYLNEELPPDQLPSLYTACDCLVHPYRGEGFGLPVLEAMACALPVIVTGGGATDDFATDEFAFRLPAVRRSIPNRIGEMELVTRGWLLEPDTQALSQRMQWLVANRAEADARGLAASEHVRRHWTWKRAAAVASEYLHALVAPEPARESGKAMAAAKPAMATPPAVAQIGQLTNAQELFRKKSPRAAWESASEAIRLRPYHPEAYLLLAEIARQAGDAASAKRCAEHARNLAPQFKAARKFLKGELRDNTKCEWLKLPANIQTPVTKSSPRVSVCLIVKNEERFIAQCLASVKGLADQIVVVDTGSIDRTAEIAKEYGAQVHSFTWCDDFSAARNASLEHATGDWILVLDADEELPIASHEALRKHMQDPAVIAWRLPIVDAGSEDTSRSYVPRLFRNAPGIFFAGRVHEHAFGSVEQLRKEWGLDNRMGTATLVHHGYTKELTRERGKVGRNLRLLELAIEESPTSPLLLMNLGLELSRSGRLDEGLAKYNAAFATMSAEPSGSVVPELREMLLTQFASYLISSKHHKEAVQVLTSPLARQSNLTASLHYLLGMAYVELQQFAEAAEQMRQSIAKRDLPSLTPIIAEVHKGAPLHCLALCHWRLKETEAAEREFQHATNECPTSVALHLDYAKFLSENEKIAEALQLLHAFVSAHPDSAAVWLAGGRIALSKPDLLEVAVDWTGVAIQQLPNDREISAQRAEALLFSGLLQEALPLWKQLESELNASWLGALVICETALGENRYVPPSTLLGLVTKEFMSWYWRLVEMRNEPTLLQVLEHVDAVARILPGAAETLRSIIKELSAPAPA